MIIVRSPLRVTLGGGGTDLPSYYRQHEGFLVAGAIDKYVYITVMRPFNPGIFLKYSRMEQVARADEIEHPIFREALSMLAMPAPQIEITSLADIPSGTGLGSSGSFTTALVKALFAHQRKILLPHQIAEMACHIEIDRLNEPVGKQDQYISAYGGLTCLTFHKDDTVTAEPLGVRSDDMLELEERLLLFFTGFSRSAGEILKDQKIRTQKNDAEIVKNLHSIKDLGYRSRDCLAAGNFEKFGKLMQEQWEQKQRRSPGMSNPQIDAWYKKGMENGAMGGKLVGAGGGGFLMFLADNPFRLRKAMTEEGLQEVRFRFDFNGSQELKT